MAEQRDMSGVLFKNTRKTEGDNRPEYDGKIMVGGKEYRLAAWIKEGRKGKFMSLAVSEFGEGRNERQEPSTAPADELNDDPPF